VDRLHETQDPHEVVTTLNKALALALVATLAAAFATAARLRTTWLLNRSTAVWSCCTAVCKLSTCAP
jgi:hypothetical protein